MMPDRDGTGPRARSWRKKGKRMGRRLGDCADEEEDE